MTISLLSLSLLAALSVGAPATEKEAVLETVQTFFDSMAEKDPAKARSVLLEDGLFYSIRDQDGQPLLRAGSNRRFIDGLAGGPGMLERMWEPTVLVNGSVAVVWTRYDFHLEGRFSHCGIDAFTLLKTPDGWKITGGAYSVIREGCPQSPLGPPEGR